MARDCIAVLRSAALSSSSPGVTVCLSTLLTVAHPRLLQALPSLSVLVSAASLASHQGHVACGDSESRPSPSLGGDTRVEALRTTLSLTVEVLLSTKVAQVRAPACSFSSDEAELARPRCVFLASPLWSIFEARWRLLSFAPTSDASSSPGAPQAGRDRYHECGQPRRLAERDATRP